MVLGVILSAPQSHTEKGEKSFFVLLYRRTGQESIEARQIYIDIERFNNSSATFLLYMTVFMDATLFSSAALMPICYSLFGFPEPNHWTLPIPVKWVTKSQRFIIALLRKGEKMDFRGISFQTSGQH